MLTPKKLFKSGNATFFRLMVGIIQNVSKDEYTKMLNDIRDATVDFSELEDGSPEALIKAHAGSPINRKR